VAGYIDEIRYGTLDRAYVDAMAALPAEDDGPFYMLNLMRYRALADYPDGYWDDYPADHPEDRPPISGQAADDLYAPLEILQDLGAEVVLFGDVVDQPRGNEAWDRVAMVRYPTVRSFFEMQSRPDFIAAHVHKDAGMDLTILAVCHAVSGSTGPGPRILVDLVEGVEAPDGAPGRLVFRVDGTPVGDGRTWSTLVITTIPDGGAPGDGARDDLLVAAGQSTTVTVDAYVKELP
jgi:hypothetical protein